MLYPNDVVMFEIMIGVYFSTQRAEGYSNYWLNNAK